MVGKFTSQTSLMSYLILNYDDKIRHSYEYQRSMAMGLDDFTFYFDIDDSSLYDMGLYSVEFYYKLDRVTSKYEIKRIEYYIDLYFLDSFDRKDIYPDKYLYHIISNRLGGISYLHRILDADVFIESPLNIDLASHALQLSNYTKDLLLLKFRQFNDYGITFSGSIFVDFHYYPNKWDISLIDLIEISYNYFIEQNNLNIVTIALDYTYIKADKLLLILDEINKRLNIHKGNKIVILRIEEVKIEEFSQICTFCSLILSLLEKIDKVRIGGHVIKDIDDLASYYNRNDRNDLIYLLNLDKKYLK